MIIAPDGTAPVMAMPHRDETMVRTFVKAQRWRRQIESGKANSITGRAVLEGVTDPYVCRILPLTCLAPDIVEAILDAQQPKGRKLAALLRSIPLTWEERRRLWLQPSKGT